MKRVRLFTLIIGCLMATNAAAESARDFVTWSGEIGAVSDYRWRGVSLTDNNPAIQGGVTAALANGLYVNVWGSAPATKSGDDEIDLSAGYSFAAAGGEADLAIQQYTYPALDDANYATFVGTYSHPIGGWTVRGRLEYAPPQRNLTQKSLYLAFETEAPVGETGLSVNAGAGWEDGAFTLEGQKWDYTLGLGYDLGRASFNLSYVSTDEDAPAGVGDLYDGGFIAGISTSF